MRKRLIWIVLGWAAGAGWAGAQEELITEEEWRISVGGAAMVYTRIEEALMRRADSGFDSSEDFRDGDTDGDGWGVRVSAEKGGGEAFLHFIRSDYVYENIYVPNATGHRIDTLRTDLDVGWSQVAGVNANGTWGWKAGVRYTGEKKDIIIAETGIPPSGVATNDLGETVIVDFGPTTSVFETDDDVRWFMATVGYWGEVGPWNARYFRARGEINVLLGEAEGLARSSRGEDRTDPNSLITGNDENPTDGIIQETYDEAFSLAYGLNFRVGLEFTLWKHLLLGIDYRREWLYSFASTDSGIVVFPDNDDAKFILLTRGVYFYLDAVW